MSRLFIALLALAPIAISSGACFNDDTTPNPVTAPDASPDVAQRPAGCGQPGQLCAGNQWCEYSLVGSCGGKNQDIPGSCSARPTGQCGTECPGLCACNGKIYCNACEAHAAGSDVATGKECFPGPGELLSYALYTDPPKIAIFKKDADRTLCTRITLVKTLGAKYGLNVPNQWGVESSEITNNLGDCSITTAGLPPTPVGKAPAPINGQGNVTFSADFGHQGTYPCSIGIDARLAFEATNDYPWAPNVDVLKGTGIEVGGGCP